jgi:hypothetical protein
MGIAPVVANAKLQIANYAYIKISSFHKNQLK